MTDHTKDQTFPDEPAGGWQTAPQLHDAELVSIVCCKYTGALLSGPDHACAARALGGHQDVDCAAVYVRGKDSEGNDLHVGEISEITVSIAGSDPTVQ